VQRDDTERHFDKVKAISDAQQAGWTAALDAVRGAILETWPTAEAAPSDVLNVSDHAYEAAGWMLREVEGLRTEAARV